MVTYRTTTLLQKGRGHANTLLIFHTQNEA